MKYLRRVFVLLVLLAILIVTPALAAPGGTTRVSVSSSGGQGNDLSYDAAISTDGHYVAFSSEASNLVAGDTNGTQDVFVHDRTTGVTTRVSVNSSGGQGNEGSIDPSISADGRYVAFYSHASNLVVGDTNTAQDVFVHDRTTGATTRVSVSSSSSEGFGDSLVPSISADGRYVAFTSDASLVAGDTNGQWDIFVHDRTTSATSRVSVSSSGVQGTNSSDDPSISADGRYVAFWSWASNLVTGDTNGIRDVFVHDRATGATTRVSVDSSGGQGNADSYSPSISADGRYVAFHSLASNLVAGDTNGQWDVFVHDRTTGATTRVSVDSSGGQGNNSSGDAAISADGRYVAFASRASNLVVGDTNGTTDVFVYDRTTGATMRVSLDSSDGQGNNISDGAAISADGRYVAFYSAANNLVAGDTNVRVDVFVHELDITPPVVVFGAGSVPPSNGANLTVGPSQLVVHFSENVLSNGSQHAANSGWNYMLLRPGPNGVFDTTIDTPTDPEPICDSDHVSEGDDERIDILTISYAAGTFAATITIDPFYAPLANGTYRLYVCGEASVWDLASNPLNGGANTAINFTVGPAAAPAAPAAAEGNRSKLPSTGFPPNRVTLLPPQTLSYIDLGDLWLEVPKLGLKIPIVGVPKKNDEWNVSWLGKNAGWLESSAYPSWNGNSVLTGHVWNADNSAGPFVYLNTLWWGDKIIVHLSGQQYIYEVRSVKQIAPTDVSAMMKHEDLPWLTLVSCKGYDDKTGEYNYRVLVRAVLVQVK